MTNPPHAAGAGRGRRLLVAPRPRADLERTAHHEAGHVVAAKSFGYGVGPASIVPAENFNGIMFHSVRKPDVRVGLLILWPVTMRRKFEEAVVISLAGPVASDLYMREAGYLAEDEDERLVRTMLEGATDGATPSVSRLPAAESRKLAAAECRDDPLHDDWQQAHEVAYAYALSDAPIAVSWLRTQTRQLLVSRWRHVTRVADALLERQTLSKRELRELLNDL